MSATDFSIVDATGANSYPISGYSWVVVYKKPADAGRAKALYNVLSWLVGPAGQANAKSVDYVPLPVNVQNEASARCAKCKGKRIRREPFDFTHYRSFRSALRLHSLSLVSLRMTS